MNKSNAGRALAGAWLCCSLAACSAASVTEKSTNNGNPPPPPPPPPPGSVTVTPPSVILNPGQTQPFAATVPTVEWSVRPTSGGSITTGGLYTAGPTPGSYAVVAREPVSGVSGEATVTVLSPNSIVTHGIAIPPSHPRLWFSGRLDAAKAWYQGHPFTPGNGDYQDRALRGLLNDEAAQCRGAIDWALATTTGSMPMTGVSCDNCRWFGEDIILTYDWCYAHMTAAERATFVSATNTWLDHWRTQPWGGVPMHHNNYYWGYLRNELLWAITSYEASPTMAETFLDDVFTTRLAGDFNPATLAGARGGVGHEGTQYGPYPAWYATVPFVSAGLLGRDVLSETNFWKEAVYAYVYSVTPSPTTFMGRTEYTFFPWSDDEQWANGGQVGSVKGNFMTAAAMRWSGIAVGQHARQWLNLTSATADRFAQAVDAGGTAQSFSSLPLDYYAPGPKYFWGRSAWGTGGTTFMLQLGEGPGSGHQHLDWGTWQIWRGGRFLSRESPSYGDSIAGFAGNGTVTADLALGHNTLLIDGTGPRLDQWISGQANVRRLESRAGYAYAAVDLTGASLGADGGDFGQANSRFAHWEREFVFFRGLETLVILDRIQSSTAGATKTFLAHCEANPSVGAGTATCTNGSQSLVMTTLVPATSTYRVVTEGGSIGQYRIEVDTSPGTAQSYIVTVLQAKSSGAASLSPSVVDGTGTLAVTLDGSNGVTFDKGMTSSGGSLTVAGAGATLTSTVQGISVTDAGPVWE
ncbi:MAG: heparinase II/III family protein [Deltaproteobacteria bacterium]|nr:heparinase II/III family protein [Deltaproteobacteria bacterium]